MPTAPADNLRSSDRVGLDASTVVLIGLDDEPVPAVVIDESFGGIGVAAPIKIQAGSQLGMELTVETGALRSVALIRHTTALPSGCRLGLEWKALALSRGLRELLNLGQSSTTNQQLIRILPGGLSVMWKLYEAKRWEHLLASADRLRKEAAACHVHSLSKPIDNFQDAIRHSMTDQSAEDVEDVVQRELTQLIATCVEVVKTAT